MAFTSTVIPGKQFADGETVTYAKLNLLGQPVVSLTGPISSLSDVDDATPNNGQPLVWDSTLGKWAPGTVDSAWQQSPSNLAQRVLFNQQYI